MSPFLTSNLQIINIANEEEVQFHTNHPSDLNPRDFCDKSISLRDIFKERKVKEFLKNIRTIIAESGDDTIDANLADSLKYAEKQFDFVEIILAHFNRDNTGEDIIPLEVALREYVQVKYSVDSICYACRQSIEFFLKGFATELSEELSEN